MEFERSATVWTSSCKTFMGLRWLLYNFSGLPCNTSTSQRKSGVTILNDWRLWYKQMNLAIGPSGRGQTLLARAILQASHDLKIKSWIRLLLKRMETIGVRVMSTQTSVHNINVYNFANNWESDSTFEKPGCFSYLVCYISAFLSFFFLFLKSEYNCKRAPK